MSVKPLWSLIRNELASRGLEDAYAGKGGGKPRRTEWDAIFPGFGTRHYASGRQIHIVQVDVGGHTMTVTIGKQTHR